MLKLQYIPVGTLKLNPQNPRVIKDEAFKRLCDSLKEDRDYFEARPVLVNKDMEKGEPQPRCKHQPGLFEARVRQGRQYSGLRKHFPPPASQPVDPAGKPLAAYAPVGSLGGRGRA